MINVCKNCEQEFERIRRRKFCSWRCSSLWRHKHQPFGFQKGHKTRVGIKHPEYFKESRKSEGNPCWKGRGATIGSIHCWVRDNFEKPNECEICGEEKKLEWSNKDHKYSRNREDWQCVCRSCHMKYDYKYLGRKHGTS